MRFIRIQLIFNYYLSPKVVTRTKGVSQSGESHCQISDRKESEIRMAKGNSKRKMKSKTVGQSRSKVMIYTINKRFLILCASSVNRDSPNLTFDCTKT